MTHTQRIGRSLGIVAVYTVLGPIVVAAALLAAVVLIVPPAATAAAVCCTATRKLHGVRS